MRSLLNYEVYYRLPIREWVPTHVQVRQYAEASGDFNPTIKFYGFVKARLENSLICDLEAINDKMERVLWGTATISVKP